jgi:hypothetical protein
MTGVQLLSHIPGLELAAGRCRCAFSTHRGGGGVENSELDCWHPVAIRATYYSGDDGLEVDGGVLHALRP